MSDINLLRSAVVGLRAQCDVVLQIIATMGPPAAAEPAPPGRKVFGDGGARIAELTERLTKQPEDEPKAAAG